MVKDNSTKRKCTMRESVKFVKLRQAEKGDLDDIYNLVCELEENKLNRNNFENVFLSNLQNPEVFYIIAELEGKTIGFGSIHVNYLLHHCGRIAEVQELIVDEGYRDRGIGSLMMDELKRIAAHNGCLQIEVCCSRKRDNSLKFYEAEGFIKSHFKLTCSDYLKSNLNDSSKY